MNAPNALVDDLKLSLDKNKEDFKEHSIEEVQHGVFDTEPKRQQQYQQESLLDNQDKLIKQHDSLFI